MGGKNAGRSGRTFTRLRNQIRSEHRPCCYCGQPIDYTLPATHAQSFTVEHKRPLSLHPEGAEDYDNLDAAHRSCNSSRGNGDPTPPIGATSRHW